MNVLDLQFIFIYTVFLTIKIVSRCFTKTHSGNETQLTGRNLEQFGWGPPVDGLLLEEEEKEREHREGQKEEKYRHVQTCTVNKELLGEFKTDEQKGTSHHVSL